MSYYRECSNPACAYQRAHDTDPTVPRGPQLVPVSPKVPLAFCSVECVVATLEAMPRPLLRRCASCDVIAAVAVFGFGQVCNLCTALDAQLARV